jgi:diacylglycerol O-acyltransferase
LRKIRLTAVDAAFLRMETRRTPMHIVLMHVFRMPAGKDEAWLHDLVADMRATRPLIPPFDQRLENPSRFRRFYDLVAAESIDLDHHVKYWTLADPGGDDELNHVLERVYTTPLDMKRPLWECHVVGGVAGGRFAILLKVHHAAQDGVGAIATLRRWLSVDPSHNGEAAPWGIPAEANPVFAVPPVQTMQSQLRAWWRGMRFIRNMKRAHKQRPEGGLLPGLEAPQTPFNIVLSTRRNFARQTFDLQRFRTLSHRTGATVNDVAVSVIGGALRYYLDNRNALPAQSLVVSIPVGLPRNDGKVGNQVSTLYCTFGTDKRDPIARLRAVAQGVQQAKETLSKLPSGIVDQLMQLGMWQMTIAQFLGLSRFARPFFSVPVSNLVFGSKPLYLRGARLETSFPSSVLFDTYALNVTIVGYADRLSMGFTSCPEAMPDLDRLAAFTAQALDDLEAAAATAEESAVVRA